MNRRWGWLNRREWFTRGGLLALAGGAGTTAAAAREPRELYTSIGVRPLINAKGTFTIVSGSLSLPEVKQAMDEASRNYVHLDELMEGVSKRLAELTKAEWGIVTAGCAAAMTHFTAASIAGSNPERMQRLPDLTGMKSEVIIPNYSRNVYDHAIRMLGVKIVNVGTPAELEAAFNEKTAMCYILAGPGDEGPLGTAAVSAAARKRGVPVLVDAAAEILTIPNIHLQRGATAVAYSGGKCLRGPQAAGLLLGEKKILQAAWLNSAPHHAFGRSLKVGKEEIMGMLAAVEAWTRRDYKAEFRMWEGWLEGIAKKVSTVSGVQTRISQPNGLSNHAPGLRIEWDPQKIGISGVELSKVLLDTEPRIILGGAGENFISMNPYMMQPGDEQVVASRIHAVLAKPPKIDRPAAPSGPLAQIAGIWDVEMEYSHGSAAHQFAFEQKEGSLAGIHKGETLAGDLMGTVAGNQVKFRSSHRYEGTRLGYEFEGALNGDTLSGTVDMGEYGIARWTAKRHAYQTRGRRG